ncbi:M23 family metallopeptidase [Hymenobacter pini]|uniref:M23 family metallopeptidase n=1 Tax=Hymenobacter pini TaxID=2880879 RepID=UPI00293D8EFC|nr:M23 family metallopeptidase [Hymenobacter pini]
MRTFLLASGAGLLSVVAHAQQPNPILVTATDYKGSGVIVEAQNTSVVPYTVVLTVDGINLQSSATLPLRKVVQPSKKKQVLTRLTPTGGPYKYSYNFRYYLGNTMNTVPNAAYVYELPFEAGKEYLLMQGNNGTFSHSNKMAVDFSMPEGTVVCAARAGVVAEIRQDSNGGCPTETCKEQGNYITIFHEDGTLASYYHFRQNGSLVQVGQQVAVGTPIGYSGNTGWSSGPHLHFEVDTPTETQRLSLPVKFRVQEQVLEQLQAGSRYKR